MIQKCLNSKETIRYIRHTVPLFIYLVYWRIFCFLTVATPCPLLMYEYVLCPCKQIKERRRKELSGWKDGLTLSSMALAGGGEGGFPRIMYICTRVCTYVYISLIGSVVRPHVLEHRPARVPELPGGGV